ncbi:MAG TPA: hypothetical protein VM925_33160 [Labilithrix sp.]|nr:hypothetical protein [Labilithrix sp.]
MEGRDHDLSARLVARTPKAAVLGASLLASASTLLSGGLASAAAPDEREQCAASAEQAQQLRDEGKYRRAREQMLVCVRNVCPGPIKVDCGKWLSELDRDAPTVVFGARDNKGTDIVDVKVSMDGAPLQARLDGKPVLVDSGEHSFKFEGPDGTVREERVLLRAAEKARPIIVTFAAPDAPVPPRNDSNGTGAFDKTLVPPLVAAGIGVVALGSFAIFGLAGKSDVDELQRCKPMCAEERVDSARTKLTIADVSLGVGVVALGVATYLYLTRPVAHAASETAIDASKIGRALRFDGGAIRGGGFAAVGGRF